MNRDEVWAGIDAHRVRVADLLDTLTPAEWGTRSLCPEWTVKDVAAHLTLQQLRMRDLFGSLNVMVAARGNLDRVTAELARRKSAASTPEDLTAQIRATVGSQRHNVGVTYRETLIDILVHAQDIAIPLGRTVEAPPELIAVAATRCWTMRWPPRFPAVKALKAYRVVATDADWTFGEGPEVRASMADILLMGAGRAKLPAGV